MADMWTPAQKNAIEATNGTVLVSAAAGSGKTSVLVQRVIRRITDEQTPIDIDKFLIVTFTNASAYEMRVRISEKLAEMIKKDTTNTNLQRQQMLLKNATIGTIHSFCSKLVKENFYKIGITPKFRIADENELSLLKLQAIETVLNKFYDEANPEFLKISDLFSSEKDDNKLIDAVFQVYEFTRSLPFPEQWFSETLEIYNICDLNTNASYWGKTLLDYAKYSLDTATNLITSAAKIAENHEKIKKAYLPALNEDIYKISEIKSALDFQTWDEIVQKISSFSCAKFKPLKAEDADNSKAEISCKRAYVKNIMEKLKKYFSFSTRECKESAKILHNILKTLFDVVLDFSEEFAALKLIKNIADFSDLEHWALKLLIENSETAKDISDKFEEIMIDEYQDVNKIQELIFKMVSKNESNLFMVGDVKQSIYKFRQAEPTIFLGKKDDYSLYNPSQKNHPAKIILDKNFRSRAGIIDIVNFIFKNLMSKATGDIEYNSEEALSTGSNYSESNSPCVSLQIIDTSEIENSDDVTEARAIAEIIFKMIFEKHKIKDKNLDRPVTYRDFCILLRSSNKHAPIYAKELNNCGIPAWANNTGKFFEASEISMMLSLLQIIDNPIQDIPLIAAMTSPIFGFCLDDISEVRLVQKDVPMYFALKKHAHNGDERFLKFIKKIEDYRNLSAATSCNKLIEYIYEDTGLIAIAQAMPGGEIRKANLLLLAGYAEKYDGETCNGLSGFISFLSKLENNKLSLSAAESISESANVVRIMSIHKSKGLEFPICILAGCSKKFNTEKSNMLMHSSLGIGVKLKSADSLIQYNNFIRQAIALQIRQEEISEELRTLYVALTRAKEKLITVLSLKNVNKSIEKIVTLCGSQENILPFITGHSDCFAEWLLACAARHPAGNKLRTTINAPLIELEENQSSWEINIIKPNYNFEISITPSQSNTISTMQIDEDLMEKIKSNFDFKYPDSNLKEIPLKIAASKLAQGEHWKEYIAASRPAFISGHKIPPAAQGTALHKFLYFANFECAAKNLDKELESLIKKGFFSMQEADLLSKLTIKNFFKSNLIKRILKSPTVLKEYRFTMNAPPSKLNLGEEEESTLLVQGAIDCVFKEGDSFTIIDYKTDKINNIEKLYEKYSKQLEIYKYAFEQCEGIKVKEIVIYSFHLSKFVSKTISAW